MIPILLGVTILIFFLFNLLMANPAERLAGRHATAEMVATINAELGLDKPLVDQYLFSLKQLATLEFGRSWSTKQNVTTMISDGFSATVCLVFPPFFASIIASVALAMFAAYRKGSWLDKGIVISCLAFLSISSLVYILALQYLLAFEWGLFPISGWDPSWEGRWQYLYLPWMILFALSLGVDILLYRSVILDEAFQDYVRTARAKGLSTFTVYSRHILKNALIPIITNIVIEMPLLITGAVLVESFFSIPGMGGIMVKALNESDLPVIRAMTILVAVAYMFFNLAADLLYAAADPRVRLS